MGLKIRLCAVIVCLTAAGCSNNEILIKKQMEMDARLEQLIQGNGGTNSRLAEIAGELKNLDNRVKAHSTDLEELKTGYRELKSSLDSSPHAEGKATPSGSSKIVVVNKGGGADHDSAEQDAYMKAFGLFSMNNYGGAIEAFQGFIREYPSSEYAVNAQYWIGESFYTQRDYTKALDAFAKVVDSYPNGKKVPDAMLKLGFSLIKHESTRESTGSS